MTSERPPFERAMALSALSGFKMTLGPAFLAASRKSSSAGTWALLALGEMLVDKVRILPPRYRPGLAIPHAIAGAWVARESLRDSGIDDPLAPLAGAAVAAGVSCVASLARIGLRAGLGAADPLLGLGEDYVALRLGTETNGVTLGQVSELARDRVESLGRSLKPALPPRISRLLGAPGK
jgi:hypothetical protein